MKINIGNLAKSLKENSLLIIGGLAITCVIVLDKKSKNHDEQLKSMPDSYWVYKAEEEKAKVDIQKAKYDQDIKMAKLNNDIKEKNSEESHKREMERLKERHEFEKSLPDTYWAYKAAVEDCKTREKESEEARKAAKFAIEKGYDNEAAKIYSDLQTKTSQYSEMRKMAETLVNAVENRNIVANLC